jgi:hypothetical protein
MRPNRVVVALALSLLACGCRPNEGELARAIASSDSLTLSLADSFAVLDSLRVSRGRVVQPTQPLEPDACEDHSDSSSTVSVSSNLVEMQLPAGFTRAAEPISRRWARPGTAVQWSGPGGWILAAPVADPHGNWELNLMSACGTRTFYGAPVYIERGRWLRDYGVFALIGSDSTAMIGIEGVAASAALQEQMLHAIRTVRGTAR